ncbi:hypothetical protein MMPV_000619 [Pyropia vietnamensis]
MAGVAFIAVTTGYGRWGGGRVAAGGGRVCTGRPAHVPPRMGSSTPSPSPTEPSVSTEAAAAPVSSGVPPPVVPMTRLDTEAAFRTALRAPAADGGLVVVGYTAPHCRSCVAVRRRVSRLAAEYGGRDVHFFELDVTAAGTGRLARAAGLTALPTFHLFTSKDGVPGHLDTVVAGPAAVGGLLRERIEVFTGDGFDVDQFSFEEGD